MGLEEFLTRVPRPAGAPPLPSPPPGPVAQALTKLGQVGAGAGAAITAPETAAAAVISIPLSLVFQQPTANDEAYLRRRDFNKENDTLQKQQEDKRQVQDEFNKFMERLLNHPASPPQELQKGEYPFHGGQESGVLYRVFLNDGQEKVCYGPVGGIRIHFSSRQSFDVDGGSDGIFHRHIDEYSLEILCCGIVSGGTPNVSSASEYKWYSYGGGSYLYDEPRPGPVANTIVKILRQDGKSDTGNPPPLTPPITSKPGQNFALPTVSGTIGAGGVVGTGGTAIGMGLGAGSWATSNPIPNTESMPRTSTGTESGTQTPTMPRTSTGTESGTQTPTMPRINTGTEPTIGTTENVPAVLIGPASVPGSITTTKAFNIPATGQTITTDKTTGQPIVETKPGETVSGSKTTASPVIPDIEQIKKDIQGLLNPKTGLAPIVAGTVLTAPIITTIANNTTRNAIATAAEEGTCNSFKPNRCNGGIAQNIENIAGHAANNNTLLKNLSDILGAGNQALIPFIWEGVRTLNTSVGDVAAIGSIGKFLTGLKDWSGVSRVMDAITMVATVHNALMLSNNIEHTLFQVIDNVISIPTLIVNPHAEHVDSEKVVGHLVASFFESVLGAKG